MSHRHLFPIVLFSLSAAAANAQAPRQERSEWLGGGGGVVGFPQGDFANATDTGWGFAGHGVFTPKGGAFGIRMQAAVVIYGSRTYKVTIPGTGGLVTDDLTTDNWLLNAGVGPQLMLRSGPVRPYVYGLAGVGYFATDTTLGQSAYAGFGSTNYDDTTFAWSAGAGLLLSLSKSVALDVGVHYVGNGTVRYLAEGDLRPSPTGLPPLIVPRRTEANLIEITLGLSFGR